MVVVVGKRLLSLGLMVCRLRLRDQTEGFEGCNESTRNSLGIVAPADFLLMLKFEYQTSQNYKKHNLYEVRSSQLYTTKDLQK